jgi:CheY-like chemotaxis protein
MKLLLVEDSAANSMVIRSMLASEGLTVEVAPNGEQALVPRTLSNSEIKKPTQSTPFLDKST